jgi:hypothetical protein
MRFRVFDAQIMTPQGTEVVIQEASTFVGVQQYASIRYGYVLNQLALGTYNRHAKIFGQMAAKTSPCM